MGCVLICMGVWLLSLAQQRLPLWGDVGFVCKALTGLHPYPAPLVLVLWDLLSLLSPDRNWKASTFLLFRKCHRMILNSTSSKQLGPPVILYLVLFLIRHPSCIVLLKYGALRHCKGQIAGACRRFALLVIILHSGCCIYLGGNIFICLAVNFVKLA